MKFLDLARETQPVPLSSFCSTERSDVLNNCGFPVLRCRR